MLNSLLPEPAISVIIPARNEERYIKAALASAAGQTLPISQLEVIVVDNGSTDETRAMVEAFRMAEPALALTLLQHDQPGVAGAKNRGAAASRGRYLIFLDADSRMAPDLGQRILEQACRGHAAGSIRVVADSRDRLDLAFFELMEFGKVRFGIRAQMFYCERAIFWQVGGFNERLQVAEDREFLARLQRSGFPVCHLQKSEIATSTRRLHRLPWRLGMLTMFGRWALASQGIGRQWTY